jgi:hypothetical protein
MCLGFVVTAISAAGCAPVPDRSIRKVDFYTGHAQEGQTMLEECKNNPVGLAGLPTCINAMVARLAGQASLRTIPPLELPPPHSSGGTPQAASSKSVADAKKRSASLIKEE